METVRSLFLKARTLLNEYTEDGVLIPESEIIDLQTKSIQLADMAHKELFEHAKSDIIQEEPTTFTSIDNTTEINYKADQAIAYYIAARLAPFKKKELVNFFESKYDQLKRECVNKAVAVQIEDVYGTLE